MFIPLKDNNPSRTYPVVNITLLLANVVIFLYQLALPPYDQKLFILSNATIPARIPAFLDGHVGFEAAFLPLVTSMFLHHAPLHIAGNMLFLWIFGDNVEDFFGHFTYVFFYLVCGIGLLYPRARILTLVFIFPLPVPAVVFLGLWYVMQFLAGISTLGVKVTGGVAVWAHVGGFLLGVLLTLMARRRPATS